MTKYEAAVLTAKTDILIGSMSEFRKYAELLLGRQIYTHELDEKLMEQIKVRSHNDFVKIMMEIRD